MSNKESFLTKCQPLAYLRYVTKKYLIALADTVRASRPSGIGNPAAEADPHYLGERQQWEWMRDRLADFCEKQNPNFNRPKWLDYINR